jgi:spore coat polysaccharide biosynthesis protein SpsF
VLSRYYHAAKENTLDIVVRVTSDCPCMDAALVDRCIREHLEGSADYSSNGLKKGYPRGLAIEVFSFAVLERAFNEATEIFEREHVTPYLYMTDKFKLHNIAAPERLARPDIRITLDTPEDYALLCMVYELLYKDDNFFGVEKIVELFKERPWLAHVNEKIQQKTMPGTLEEELKEAAEVLKVQELPKAREFLLKELAGK